MCQKIDEMEPFLPYPVGILIVQPVNNINNRG